MKKMILVAMTAILANLAYAEEAPSRDYPSQEEVARQKSEFIKYLKHMIPDKANQYTANNFVKYSGKTQKGEKACELNFTNPGIDGEPNTLYVVVEGQFGWSEVEKTIGIKTNNKTEIAFGSLVGVLSSNESWGGDGSTENMITINIDKSRVPEKVTAQSKLKNGELVSVICDLRK